MAGVVKGVRSLGATRDTDGHITYAVEYLVRMTTTDDGPNAALAATGLPLPGSTYSFKGETNPWATCRWDAAVAVHAELKGDPATHYTVALTFSTKPRETQSCRTQQASDPILEPAKISGSFNRIQRETPFDRFGQPIVSSSWELFRGPQVEFDHSRGSIRVEQNVLVLGLELFTALQNYVNDRPLWGLPARTIKLTNTTWEPKFYGLCYRYFTRVYEFEIDGETFDRYILDEGTKVLNGAFDRTTGDYVTKEIAGGPPDPGNPRHFIRFTDRLGQQTRVILNGRGLPAGVMAGPSASTDEIYISLTDNSMDHSLSNTNRWLPLVQELEDPLEDYQEDAAYPRGSLVTFGGTLFIAIEYPVADINPGLVLPESLSWTSLGAPSGVTIGSTLTNAGDYDTGTEYFKGEYVRDTNRETKSGYRYVQKYNQANLLLLGIPAVL